MCDYKEINALLAIAEDRKVRVQEDMKKRQIAQRHETESSENGHQDDDDTSKKLVSVYSFETTFCLEKFIQDHPNVSYTSFTNFTDEELEELATIVTMTLGQNHRGKKMRISLKGCLFLTLTYYCLYSPLEHLAQITSIKVPTLQRIIKKVTNAFFPINHLGVYQNI